MVDSIFLGVNDVSWNNPNIKTSNLQELAEKGTILDNAYTLPICSPSRAAILTGIYPFKFGFQVENEIYLHSHNSPLDIETL